jgi:hypothetical protein
MSATLAAAAGGARAGVRDPDRQRMGCIGPSVAGGREHRQQRCQESSRSSSPGSVTGILQAKFSQT